MPDYRQLSPITAKWRAVVNAARIHAGATTLGRRTAGSASVAECVAETGAILGPEAPQLETADRVLVECDRKT